MSGGFIVGGNATCPVEGLSIRTFAEDGVHRFPSKGKRARAVELVIHETVTRSVDSTIAVLKKRGLSVHLVMGADGALTQHGDLATDILWHASQHNGSSFGVTLSLGAASYPTDADNEIDLLNRATEALDEARALGRNRVWCYMRRPRVPVRTPVYLEGSSPLLLGYTQDLSPSGLFVATAAPIDVDMRCALSFPLPTAQGKVHVIGRVVRTVPLRKGAQDARAPGMGVEFERFGAEDRHAIEAYLYENESRTLRPEGLTFSV